MPSVSPTARDAAIKRNSAMPMACIESWLWESEIVSIMTMRLKKAFLNAEARMKAGSEFLKLIR
ncbi:hypothetical protein [Acidaminobacter sp.]|uniref:hypothetical protein n=1 Tax=Acidaminobacter sp. TaxID=1872102 RepID=UPI00138155F5|nr:hypothetical protein [Acidaminobacter sp.]MDK9710843.1 hypothetical protein [Acidaminobacter sp.]MZQ98306.1 hypothetical protein [Acidaminobacter sp.]